MSRRLIIPLALWLTAGCLQASADDETSGAATASTNRFSLHGFGTAGAVASSEHRADFIGGIAQPNGAGHSRNVAFGPDSRLGLQLDGRLTDRFTVVVQAVSQHQYDGTYRPAIEWANIKYAFTPDLSVRLGRIALPAFMISESRLVGYANPWVRPPEEVYGNEAVTSNDGIDATWRLHAGGLTGTLQGLYGSSRLRLPAGLEADAHRTRGANAVFEYGPAAFHIHYIASDVQLQSSSIDALFDGYTQLGNTLSAIPGLQQFGAQAYATSDRYRPADFKISFLTLGFNYDPGAWLVTGEWVRITGGAVIPDEQAGYITGAYRIRQFMPYFTLARLRADANATPGVSTEFLPPPLAQGAAALNSGLNALLSLSTPRQHSISAGVRWDFMKDTDLKIQYDRITLGAGSQGLLTNAQPGFKPGGTVNLISIAVDFVF